MAHLMAHLITALAASILLAVALALTVFSHPRPQRNHTTAQSLPDDLDRTVLRTWATGRHMTTSAPSTPARISLLYALGDPLLVHVNVTTPTATHRYAVARDLLLQAAGAGSAGEGLIRVLRTTTVLSLTFHHPADTTETGTEPADSTRTETVAMALDPVFDLLHRSLRAIPLGTEDLGIDAALDHLFPGPTTQPL